MITFSAKPPSPRFSAKTVTDASVQTGELPKPPVETADKVENVKVDATKALSSTEKSQILTIPYQGMKTGVNTIIVETPNHILGELSSNLRTMMMCGALGEFTLYSKMIMYKAWNLIPSKDKVLYNGREILEELRILNPHEKPLARKVPWLPKAVSSLSDVKARMVATAKHLGNSAQKGAKSVIQENMPQATASAGTAAEMLQQVPANAASWRNQAWQKTGQFVGDAKPYGEAAQKHAANAFSTIVNHPKTLSAVGLGGVTAGLAYQYGPRLVRKMAASLEEKPRVVVGSLVLSKHPDKWLPTVHVEAAKAKVVPSPVQKEPTAVLV